MKRVLPLVCLLAACGPHDVRLELDSVPGAATQIIVTLALGNEVALKPLLYPIASNSDDLTLVVSLPQRSGWVSATVVATDSSGCDLAIAAGGIDNGFSEKVDDQALLLYPTITTECNLPHTPGMLAFDAGQYVLGCDLATDTGCEPYESPQTAVTMGAFELDATEVTVGAYRDCVHDDGACPAPLEYTPALHLPADAAQDGLTWAAASDFCTWAHKALPTEAQWEAAMRGPEGRLYPWGSEPPTCLFGNFYDDLSGAPCVPQNKHLLDERRYEPGVTPLGIADAGGNVTEWMADYFAERSTLNSATLLTGPATGAQYVGKGGSFVDFGTHLRGASRVSYDPDGTSPDPRVARGFNIGVRCGLARQ